MGLAYEDRPMSSGASQYAGNSNSKYSEIWLERRESRFPELGVAS